MTIDNSTVSVEDKISETTANAIFRRKYVRSDGNTCARTDFVFNVKGECKWVDRMKEREEKARQKALQRQQKQANNVKLEAPMPRPTILAQTQQQIHQQLVQQQQHALAVRQQQQQQQQIMQQQQAMMYNGLMMPGAPYGMFGGGMSPQQQMLLQQQQRAAAENASAMQHLRLFAEHASQQPGTPAFRAAALQDPILQQRIRTGMCGEVERHWLENEINTSLVQQQMKRDMERRAQQPSTNHQQQKHINLHMTPPSKPVQSVKQSLPQQIPQRPQTVSSATPKPSQTPGRF